MNFAGAVDIAVTALKEIEQFSPKAYPDVNGYAIGYGNHYYRDGSKVQKGDTITPDAAAELLRFTAAQTEKDIRDYVTAPLSSYQYAALISLAYNCGEQVRNFKIFDLINSGADTSVIYQQWIKTCITSKGVYNQDLYERRIKEWNELYMHKAGASIGDILLIAAVSWGVYHVLK